MKKYNHAYTLAFSVNSDRDKDAPVDANEIIPALLERVADLIKNDELDEALGAPWDTYENQEIDHGRRTSSNHRLDRVFLHCLHYQHGFTGKTDKS